MACVKCGQLQPREDRRLPKLGGNPKRVDSLDGRFDPDRFFCLIGTNHRDYDVAWGMSRKLAGEMSDGLVKIENAAVHGAPRAFVYRSHSGHYGIVNSEEGYQNLVRFLFGDVRVDGVLEVEALPLPPSVRTKEITVGKTLVFAVDIAVSATDYVVGDSFWNKQRIEGEHLFRNTIVIRAKQTDNGWEVRYNMSDDAWAENTGRAVERDQTGMYVPCNSGKGFKAKLRLLARKWV